MKQIITICLLISFALLNAQNQEVLKLKLVQKDLKNEISTLNDSLLIINKKIDSLNKITEEQIIQKRLDNISDKEVITTTNKAAVLRDKPFSSSKIIKEIEPETSIVIKGFVNNFFECCIGDECGFIHFFSIEENEKTDLIRKSSLSKFEDYLEKDLSKKEKVKEENNFSELNAIARVYKFPSSQSFELSNFSKDKVEIVSYSNSFFKVKDATNKTGFIKSYGIDNENFFIEKLNELTINKAKSKKQNLLIRGANVSDVNSAGGIEISVEWLYLNENKNVKYIEFTFQPYNNVSDIQISEIGNFSNFTGQAIGPIKASEKFKTYSWENAWYNSTISCVKIIKVKIIYMDESSYTYINELPKILDENFSNSCK